MIPSLITGCDLNRGLSSRDHDEFAHAGLANLSIADFSSKCSPNPSFRVADDTATVGEALRREYTENDPEFAKDRVRRPRVIESWKTDQKKINGERYQSLRCADHPGTTELRLSGAGGSGTSEYPLAR